MEIMEERIRKEIEAFAEEYDGESVVIYGCTAFAKNIFLHLREMGIPVTAFVDNDAKKAGDKYLGVDIFLPRQYLLPLDTKKRIIVCSVHENEMLDSLYEMGYGDENIRCIDVRNETMWDSPEYAREQMELVREGIKYYEELQLKHGDGTMILIAPEASGDTFLSCAYLQTWYRLYNIADYIIVGSNRNIVDIAQMYGLSERVILISKEKRRAVLAAYVFIGEQLHMKPLSGWELRCRNSYVANPKFPFLFKESFKYETFELGKEAVPEYPQKNRTARENEFPYIKRKKSIIISPYAYSSPAPLIERKIWEEIVHVLCKKGYGVYTVGYGEKEPPIKGTQRIQFTYGEACAVLEYAGGFLAARSGLCDIVHMAECRQLIIYGRNIRNKHIFDFFSLKMNYPDFRGWEIIFENYEAADFVKCVTDYFHSI